MKEKEIGKKTSHNGMKWVLVVMMRELRIVVETIAYSLAIGTKCTDSYVVTREQQCIA
jgi:hypothetical protein